MTLLALGINHRTATVAVREQVAFTPTQLESALAELRSLPHISEAAVLSTCNRTELYCVTDAAGEQTVLDWLGRFHNLRVEELARCAYHYHDNDAARHLMRVAVFSTPSPWLSRYAPKPASVKIRCPLPMLPSAWPAAFSMISAAPTRY